MARLKQLSQNVNRFLLSFSSEAFQHQLVAKIIGVLCWVWMTGYSIKWLLPQILATSHPAFGNPFARLVSGSDDLQPAFIRAFQSSLLQPSNLCLKHSHTDTSFIPRCLQSPGHPNQRLPSPRPAVSEIGRRHRPARPAPRLLQPRRTPENRHRRNPPLGAGNHQRGGKGRWVCAWVVFSGSQGLRVGLCITYAFRFRMRGNLKHNCQHERCQQGKNVLDLTVEIIPCENKHLHHALLPSSSYFSFACSVRCSVFRLLPSHHVYDVQVTN